MEEKKPGAETQVVSDGDPKGWYPKEEIAAGPNGGDKRPDPQKEDLDEKKDSEKDPDKDLEEKKNLDEKKGGEEKKPEKKDKERETFKKSFGKGKEDPIPEKKERHPKLKEGDYTVKEDGEVVIHAKHLLDDYESVVKDVRIFFKIYDSEHNRKKAEFIAEKLLGFKSDGIRSPGKVAYDVLDKFNKVDTAEEKAEIVEKFFPDLLKHEESELKASFSPKERDDEKKPSKIEKEEDAVTEEKISTTLKIWKAENDSNIDIEKVLDDPDFFDAYNEFVFDPATGERMSIEDRVVFAAESLSDDDGGDKKKKEKEIPVGGDKKGEPPKKKDGEDKEKESVFTSTVDSNPKEWYGGKK